MSETPRIEDLVANARAVMITAALRNVDLQKLGLPETDADEVRGRAFAHLQHLNAAVRRAKQ